MGLDDLAHRVSALEELHEQGGTCDEKRCEIWRELNKLRERVKGIETKLMIFGAVLSVAGPLLANWLSKHL